MGVIYLLHFQRSYHHARDYLGYTDNLDARLAAHRAGRAARWLPPRSATGSTSSWQQPGRAIATRSAGGIATATHRGGYARSAASSLDPSRQRQLPATQVTMPWSALWTSWADR